jgi:16S rRNA C1402 (ribose-2'-O) methylase RsmI
MHERIYHGCINEVINELVQNDNHEKGEYTVVVMPKITKDTDAVSDLISMYSKNDIKAALNRLKNTGKNG